MNISENELKRLRDCVDHIKKEDKINEVLNDRKLLPLLKSVATMNKEQQVLYAMAIAESIQEREDSEKQNPGEDALPGWFKGVIDKVEEILDLIAKLKL